MTATAATSSRLLIELLEPRQLLSAAPVVSSTYLRPAPVVHAAHHPHHPRQARLVAQAAAASTPTTQPTIAPTYSIKR
ncbi:MAG TPA: LEPR-XLL domain-containing protein, partial [Tepidisphaeraceae bacterium]